MDDWYIWTVPDPRRSQAVGKLHLNISAFRGSDGRHTQTDDQTPASRLYSPQHWSEYGGD